MKKRATKVRWRVRVREGEGEHEHGHGRGNGRGHGRGRGTGSGSGSGSKSGCGSENGSEIEGDQGKDESMTVEDLRSHSLAGRCCKGGLHTPSCIATPHSFLTPRWTPAWCCLMHQQTAGKGEELALRGWLQHTRQMRKSAWLICCPCGNSQQNFNIVKCERQAASQPVKQE